MQNILKTHFSLLKTEDGTSADGSNALPTMTIMANSNNNTKRVVAVPKDYIIIYAILTCIYE